jgi:hypothetical protein
MNYLTCRDILSNTREPTYEYDALLASPTAFRFRWNPDVREIVPEDRTITPAELDPRVV